MVPRAEAREARNAADAREAVEAAQAAAAAALAAELEVVRRGRADAEAREAALQEEVNPKIKINTPRPGTTPLHVVGAVTTKLLGRLFAGSWRSHWGRAQEESYCRGSPQHSNTATPQHSNIDLSCGWASEHVDLHGRRFGCAVCCWWMAG